jgi:hypothetical protein
MKKLFKILPIFVLLLAFTATSYGVDEIKVFDKKLSQAEINTMYNAGSHGAAQDVYIVKLGPLIPTKQYEYDIRYFNSNLESSEWYSDAVSGERPFASETV